jgi:hypothetical protein
MTAKTETEQVLVTTFCTQNNNPKVAEEMKETRLHLFGWQDSQRRGFNDS